MLKERFLNWAAKIHLIFRYKQAFFSIFTLFFYLYFCVKLCCWYCANYKTNQNDLCLFTL